MRLIPLAAVLAAASAARAVNIQASNLTQTAQSVNRAEKVKAMTTHMWKAYHKYAWGYDQLDSLELKGVNGVNAWAATVFDAMDTLTIQNQTELYQQALAYVPNVDFSRSSEQVSVFNAMIVYAGGLQSAYHLDPDHPQILVEKLAQLGELLSLAWDDNNDIPLPAINSTTREGVPETTNLAEATTLSLEMDGISTLTGNTTYRTLAQLAIYAVMNMPKVLPGIPAQGIDPVNATPVGDYATWDSGSDSYFEYLLKYALLTGNEDPRYLSEWKLAVNTLLSQLTFEDNVLGNLYPAAYSPSEGGLIYTYSHLECFVGGNLLLGGAALENDTIKNAGLRLTETCYNAYNSTLTHIGPEAFCYIPKGMVNPVNGCDVTTEADQEFMSEHGFAITASEYFYRPEVLESYFYAYRITGDPIWQDRAWEAFTAIRKWTRATVAFTSLDNVNAIPPGWWDYFPSYAFAEVMKYLYLIFSDGNEVVSLDEWVFNTECHPVPYTKQSSYSTEKVSARTDNFTLHKGPIPAPSGAAYLTKAKVIPDTVKSPGSGKVSAAKESQISASWAARKHQETAGHKRATGIH